MAQTGYTPILIYASGTPSNIPSAGNLTSGSTGAELALNYADGKLYFKNSSGVVTLLASASAIGSGVTSFNTRTGAVTLSSSDVTTALGYTPPTPTGTGASGTWGISISGNAATATTATNVTGGAANEIPYQTGSGATTFLAAPSTAGTAVTWNGSAIAWGSVSATVANGTMYLNSQTVTASYTIPTGDNAMSAGPVTVATGQTVTVPTGSRWVIV